MYKLLAELPLDGGARGASYLRKFGNPSISKMLVVTWLSVRPYAKPHTLRSKRVSMGLTVNRQKRNIFIVNHQMSKPKLAVEFLRNLLCVLVSSLVPRSAASGDENG